MPSTVVSIASRSTFNTTILACSRVSVVGSKFDVVAPRLDGGVLAKLGEDRVEASFYLQAVGAGREALCAREAQGEALGDILGAGPGEQEAGARLVHLLRGASKAVASGAACLLTVRAKDQAIATPQGGDERHLRIFSA
jgi:hypothetical protein